MTQPRVLVGVGGTGGWQALAWAVAYTSGINGRLTVCHVLPDDPGLDNSDRVPLTRVEIIHPGLARAVAGARDRLGGHRVAVAIRGGDPAVALADLARDADLLVIEPPRRPVASSTAYRLVERPPCPVALIRPVPDGRAAPFAGHVVVGVDSDPGSIAALEFGFAYAATFRLPLAAAHVTERQQVDYWFDETLLETSFAVEPAALELLAVEVEPWSHKYPSVPVKRAVFAGAPVDGLLRAATGARVLVVGTAGTAGSPSGAVAGRVLAHAAGPVVLVPAGKEHGKEQRP
ncbi:MAG TPA: universal stress protein [Micromonosporaceae bacterium]